jgi:hypothetical protein
MPILGQDAGLVERPRIVQDHVQAAGALEHLMGKLTHFLQSGEIGRQRFGAKMSSQLPSL